jgi:hypothetical protein
VGLTDAYSGQVSMYLRPADEGIQLVREATAKALAIDPQYAPAHARLGGIAIYYNRDLARHIEHALALEPTNPDIIAFAAGLARRLGRVCGEFQICRIDPSGFQVLSRLC